MQKENYSPEAIEKKWQEKWLSSGLYKTPTKPAGKKFYILDMFPYPSGAGLHVGHPKGYIATDIVSRYKLLNGYSVLHPMGWDAFGLPAENYALANKVHPKKAVDENIATFKGQLEKFGFTYDWDREVNTTDPEYYRWTQWIFLKMFEKGLAYESEEPVNWCPSCKTVLANEDLEDGKCERCGSDVQQRPLRQWVLKMTAYADRLLYDLDSEELDWEEMIVEQQRNWIGRSEGAVVRFEVKSAQKKTSQIEVYTTRVDTIFGCTYCVVAPEHGLIEELNQEIENFQEVAEYVSQAQGKTELERTELQKEKTGVELKGIKAINPFNNQEVPIFVADYVLGFYGTGAVMAVPAHDERDFAFAKKYGLEIRKSIDVSGLEPDNGATTEDGVLVNSGDYTGKSSADARKSMTDWLEKEKLGHNKVNYKMRDWVFSRQRYWGEPIPIVHCNVCGTVGLPESELPLRLPEVESYQPTGTGESPLANVSDWVNTTCPNCGGPARRETNTMPQWAGSSWYYLRYIDPHNKSELISKDLEKAWMPVDLYVGGAEHATRHLLYARFWHKFLYDLGVVSTIEPFKKLIHVGLIQAEDGKKMSKRWGNVINPDDIIAQYGVDSLRVYEMFMGPFTQNIAWSTSSVIGARRFLDRVWRLQDKMGDEVPKNPQVERLIHRTIKKVSADIEDFRFNTAISALMVLVNRLEKENLLDKDAYQRLILLLFPFAPHIAEEIWSIHFPAKEINDAGWPAFNDELAIADDETVTIAVQVNGKLRDQIMVSSDADRTEVEKMALASEKVIKFTQGQPIKKIIYVEKKLVSIVV